MVAEKGKLFLLVCILQRWKKHFETEINLYCDRYSSYALWTVEFGLKRPVSLGKILTSAWKQVFLESARLTVRSLVQPALFWWRESKCEQTQSSRLELSEGSTAHMSRAAVPPWSPNRCTRRRAKASQTQAGNRRGGNHWGLLKDGEKVR